MNQNSSETSIRISSDINNNAMQLTISTIFLDKAAKAAAKQSKKQDFLQKKQDVKDSIINITAILRIINQEKTYAQIAAVNVEQNNLQQTKQQQKQQEKEKKKDKYREKRLIIQVDKETAEDFDSYILRNKINDRFFTEANINQSVIATATKSFTSQSIILTTMSDFLADFLLQKKTI